jgi:acetyltransferase-like isoleucine patch superfamily enzyme
MRSVVKLGLIFLANLVVSPLLILHAIKVPLMGKDRALEGSTQLLALFPGITGQYLRRAFLGWTIQFCDRSATISFGVICSKCDCRIEANVYIGPYCSLGSVHIGKDTLIATMVQIPSGGKMHGIDDLTKPIREQSGVWETVQIGENCWIGSGCVVMANIGRDSVIGAGAVVTKPIPEKVIAGGVPAKVIRER